ncbi:MAG TPA: hypothetical protein VFW39_05120 [Sphingomicrobium sp.]|nr:hypothetical protein [Sphingomicrobium sp.]
MRNEERINLWRARRQAGGGEPTLSSAERRKGVIAAAVDPLVRRASLSADELLEKLLAVMQAAPNANRAERRELYDALAIELDSAAEARALPREIVELHGRQLRIAVRLLESDLREGKDIFAPGYRPDGLEEAIQRLKQSHHRQQRRAKDEATRIARRQAALAGEAFPVAVQPEEEFDLAEIRYRLTALSARRPGQPVRTSGLRVFAAVFRYLFRLLRAESRIALLWVFLGPAVLLSMISLLYILNGSHYILGMDVPTFSMLGATTWIMFRNIIFRTSTALHSQRALLNLQPVGSLTIGLAQGSLYFLTYVAVFMVLIFGGHSVGAFSLPADWLGFVGWLTAVGVAGMSIGVLFGAAAIVWPYFLRFAPMIERGLEMFSGVFFVSEQLPEEYRPYMLWSPFAHALQLMRSAYFTGYDSHDASPQYFLLCLGILVVAALLAHRAVRSHSQPM